ncbi:hypothetical protein [Levilactobacillus yiduensis]|uniref:hypothetical protein n=1 Tax=Levilactobacillus yiduensis TaxID=2953880 RepID=UPI002157F24E|nr:hypothetical protein [Levilactobacillus yiduensis]
MVERFNDFFDVSDDSYYDPRLDHDERKFLNTDLLGKCKQEGFGSQDADLLVQGYIGAVVDCYSTGNKQAAHALLGIPCEMNETRIGYGKKPSSGRGPSEEILDGVFESLIKSGINMDIAKHRPPVIPLVTKNFDRDRLSDLLTNVISLQLVGFTHHICRKHGIPLIAQETIHYFDLKSTEWEVTTVDLPADGKGRPIILIPRTLVVNKYNFSAGQFVRQVVLTSRQHLLLEQGIKKSKSVLWDEEVRPFGKGMTKKYALYQIHEDPKLFDEYLASIKRLA